MSNSIQHPIRMVIGIARNLLFPPSCVGCGELLPPFEATQEVFCPLCRAAWEAAVTEAAKQSAEDIAEGLVYLAFYHSGQTDGIPERLIYHIKHAGEKRVFSFVSTRLAPRLLSAANALPGRRPEGDDKPLLFTYPPRRRSAVSKDGFDQAKELAKALALVCDGELVALIQRTHRRSEEQKTLNTEERATNAASSYKLSDKAAAVVRDRTVVVCDDLCTTGATLNYCATLLMEAGARSVILCTVAQTGGKDHRVHT